MENIDIRTMVYDSGVHYKEIAEEMGICPEHLSRLMKEELSQKNKIRIIDAIEKLKGEEKRITLNDSRPITDWYLCKDKLPENDRLVLICYINEFDDKSAKFFDYDISAYDSVEWLWIGDSNKIIAWQELPRLLPDSLIEVYEKEGGAD